MRLIDADALISIIKIQLDKDETLFNDVMKKFIDILEHSPTIDAVNEWIPCSEKPPCAYTYVEVTYEHNGKRYTTVGDIEGDGEWHTELLGFGEFFESKIIAWRPLPEPYEEDKR